jgi:hypothetical protein
MSSDSGAEQENHNVRRGPTLDRKGLITPIYGSMARVEVNQNSNRISVHRCSWALSEGGAIVGLEIVGVCVCVRARAHTHTHTQFPTPWK